ncbi:MAG: hypothetical protein WCX08_00625 [Candidatus Buchananbacteria bacterium]|jgi:hypothetical protein
MLKVSRRTILIFSIFILFVLAASAYIYFYRSKTDILLKQYIAKITNCGNITNEDECFSRDFCQGIYGPSCPTCQDLEFKNCQRIPVKVLGETAQQKNICLQSNGRWYRNKLGNFCLCAAGDIFDKTRGCVSK